MKKNSQSQSAFFNPRTFAGFLLCSAGAWLAMLSFASTPSSDTLSPAHPLVTYTAGPFLQANPSPLGAGQVDTGPRCDTSTFPCDTFHLTVSLPAGYTTTNPNATIKVTMSWTDAGSGNSDYDLYIYKLPRSDCFDTAGNPSPDCSSTDGFESADSQSASGNNPEVANIAPVNGTTNYTVHIVPYTPTGETVNVTIELLAGASGGGGGGNGTFGAGDSTVAGNPRFMNFYAPPGSTAESSSGEFNIGYDPHTHRIMVMNIGPIWRLNLPEYLAQAKPECCEALWEDVSPVSTETGLDPILFVDQNPTASASRTLASNFTGGANALYAWSDDDGTTWIQAGLGANNGGADHETIGTGNYPNIIPFNVGGPGVALNSPTNTTTRGHAAYYCSQDVVGPAACYRSDSLGAAWNSQITLPYTGSGPQGCGGLHGHLHVAPDGTIWLPVSQCNAKQGGSFSTDGGQTWTEFVVPSTLAGGSPATGISQTNGADPSVAIDANSRIYYAYVNKEANGTEGHARAATGTLNCTGTDPVTGARTNCSINWGPDIDLGTSHGIINAAEIEAVGGTAGRAAVGFLGTNHNGDYQAGAFPGDWYAFIAMTYDNGATWTTVNATPNDPVQHATGIWQQGGSGQNGDRNLLDFNEITVGDKGQVLYGYSDGCVSTGCIEKSAGNDKTAFMRVARQTGGRTLDANFDSQYDGINAPIVPKPPCLSGTRTPTESVLTWKAPDNGGSNITDYLVYRDGVYIGDTGNGTTLSYHDVNPSNNTHLVYTVKAVNVPGQSGFSNPVDLVAIIPPPPQSPCILPGVTLLTDAAGDTSAVLGVLGTPATPGSDLISFQLAQPYRADAGSDPRLVFTITTDANTSQVEGPGWAAYVAMQIVNNGTTTYKGVRLSFTGTTPNFEYYTPSPNNSGGVDGRFVTAGSNHPAESGSAWANAAHTQIVITVKASDLGLAPGDTIRGFVSGTAQSSDPLNLGAGATALYDQMPNSLAFVGSYTVNSHQVCDPRPDLVVSTLTASNNQAPQGSKVTFTAKITNQGKTSAGASSTQFKDGNTVLGSVSTLAIPANGSVTVTFSWYTASAKKGTHTITATADSGNVVAESNEGNNTKQITVSIQGNKT